MRRTITWLLGAMLLLIPLTANADHPPTTDSGIDIPWSNDLNQESFWEFYFGGPGLEVECTKFNNHGGQIPAQYEAAVVKSGSEWVRVYVDPPAQLLGPPNPNAQHPNRRYSPPFSWVMKCNIEETQVEVEAEARGFCIIDQNGTGLAYADLIHPGFADFTLNGQLVLGAHFGVNAAFGENTWTATAKPGFVLVGETEGSFFIDECGTPGTTTTTIATTTTIPEATTVPETTTSTPSGTLETLPPVIVETPTTVLTELPFTGIDPGLGVLAGLALLGLGGLLVRRSDA